MISVNDGSLLCFDFYGDTLSTIRENGQSMSKIIKLKRVAFVEGIIESISDPIQTLSREHVIVVSSSLGSTMLSFGEYEGTVKVYSLNELSGLEHFRQA